MDAKCKKFCVGLIWIMNTLQYNSYIDMAGLESLSVNGIDISVFFTFYFCNIKGFFNALESFWGNRNRDPNGWYLNHLNLSDVDYLEGIYSQLLTPITMELRLHFQSLLSFSSKHMSLRWCWSNSQDHSNFIILSWMLLLKGPELVLSPLMVLFMAVMAFGPHNLFWVGITFMKLEL